MNPFPHIIKNTRFFMFKTACISLVLMSACRNDDDEVLDKPFPVFGTCEAVNSQGNLSIIDVSKGIFTYETSGGGNIVVNPANSITISHKNYPGFKIEFWGDNFENQVFTAVHENLNGKHVKDKLGDERSMVFPDGSKLTLVSAENSGALLWASIYDGNEIHRINVLCNKLEYSSADSPYVKQLDDAEADGETATFEFTENRTPFSKHLYRRYCGAKSGRACTTR